MIRAQRHPILARTVVALLGCLIAFALTALVWWIGEWIGSRDIQEGVVMVFPLTTAWISVALVQNLVDRG